MSPSKKLICIISDFLALNITLIFTYYWFFKGSTFLEYQEKKAILIIANLLWFSIMFYSNRLYGRFEYTTFKAEIRNLFTNYLAHVFLFYLIYIFIFEKDGQFLASFYGFLLIMLSFGRLMLKLFIPQFSNDEVLNYVTIGYCDALPKIEKTIREVTVGKINYVGSFGSTAGKYKRYLGPVESIYDFMKTSNVNLVLYASNEMTPAAIRDFMTFAKHNFIDFKMIPMEMELITEGGAKLELHNGFPVLSAKDENIAYIKNRLIKRIFDLIFSSLVIIFILSWLFPLILILIRLESKGTPLFIQDRVGFRGKVFGCLKFRSMRVRENTGKIEQAKRNDRRVTRIGAFLRKTNLDEMPQFFNVFIGTMSVVGPRPHAVPHDLQFKKTADDYILRHYSKPGITGWAQVNGFRGPTDTDGKIIGRTTFDLWYLKNWSFLLDIKIIFLTVFGSKVKQNVF
jgi:putative colanic acid biosysnthesis UDP-glucose lipid carrier transferase